MVPHSKRLFEESGKSSDSKRKTHILNVVTVEVRQRGFIRKHLSFLPVQTCALYPTDPRCCALGYEKLQCLLWYRLPVSH